MTSAKDLQKHGQAIWLDFLARGFIAKGQLKGLIDADGVRGVTSNPSIFEKAIVGSGEYDEARGHMEKILKQNSKADFAYYGLALLDCLANRSEDCLRNLTEAVKLNASNRFQARNDPDFRNMADDPRFTELLYPEVPPEPGR